MLSLRQRKSATLKINCCDAVVSMTQAVCFKSEQYAAELCAFECYSRLLHELARSGAAELIAEPDLKKTAQKRTKYNAETLFCNIDLGPSPWGPVMKNSKPFFGFEYFFRLNFQTAK